ncbi:ankyrin repeat domain-containing protein [Mucilaginibacter sp. HC2]|uniref:ankyrin repeat domain-containing protein n=1 Tax=Mucilaginibacter inviolabilis TaxID=2714892 RepID=UPI001409F889|nr:ankyrin repeat domain-containing protein [Mucilaginibacter inviolabilis]NHA04177.1 ankyrin repeat domain-containing protein [Mucilaginibacter inviolabilis]
MEKEDIGKIKKFAEGALTIFICILVYQWVVDGKTPFHDAFKHTVSQTWDGVKSPVTGRVAYRMKDILNRDTITCERVVELYNEIDVVDDINCKSENGTTLLIALTKAQQRDLLVPASPLRECSPGLKLKYFNKLIANDVNLNARDNLGRTALIWNTIRGISFDFGWALTLEQKLIEHEAALHYRDKFGKTALDYARLNKNLIFINLLEKAEGRP